MLTKLFGSGLLGKKKFTKEEMQIKIVSHIKRLWDMQKKRIKFGYKFVKREEISSQGFLWFKLKHLVENKL